MSFKEMIVKGLKVAAWLLAAIIPFIAGIVAKEGAVNGFESAIGWLAMADAVIVAVLMIVRSRKKNQ